jgi:predicted nucleic acid-binding Zn ribbon protein
VRAKYYRRDEQRPPREITDILGDIIGRVGGGAGQDAAALVEEWQEVAPERWRVDAGPVGIRDGVLLVEVRSGAVASTLKHDSAALLRRITERFGPDLVSGVKLRVSRGFAEGENL